MSEEPKPLTDEDLVRVEWLARNAALVGEADTARVVDLVAEVRRLRQQQYRCPRCTFAAWVSVNEAFDPARPPADMNLVPHVLAKTEQGMAITFRCEVCARGQELDRLRSDEWLRAAAEELGTASLLTSPPDKVLADPDDILAILQKHRDGKA